VLAADGTIGIGLSVVSFFVGLPLIEFVAYLLTMAVNLVLYGTARLLDGEAVTDWMDRQELGY
jgi:hypothetical protein